MHTIVIHRGDYVFVQHAHVSDIDDIIGSIRQVRDLLEDGAPHRVMSDVRGIVRAWSASEQARILAAFDECFPDDLRLAILTPDQPHAAGRSDISAYYEKRGWPVRLFREEKPARDWLVEA